MSNTNHIDRDPGMEEILSSVDPGGSDDTYWPRFERTVMSRAMAELARRRELTEITISHLVSSWGRTLVPTAAAAAVVGAFFLVRPATDDSEVGVIAVEEELVRGIDGQSIPEVLRSEDFTDAGGVVFASEIF